MVHPIILAAGKGTRMGGNLPKALVHFKNEPLVFHVVRSVKAALPETIPTIVIGHKGNDVRISLGEGHHFVEQKEQRGTGHAVASALPFLFHKPENIIVLYADQPLLSANTIKKLTEIHTMANTAITMGTVTIPDFKEWRQCFERFGRVLRSSNSKVTNIREWKDATKEEREITEVSPSYFCFKRIWLETALHSLKDNNASHEYYLTDVIEHAVNTGESIETIAVEPHEALGVNTPDELALAEAFG